VSVIACGSVDFKAHVAMQVTDAHDRHTLMTVLQTYYTPAMLEPGHALSPSGVYQSLDLANHRAYLDYIGNLPIIASPDVFGLHDNADISKDLKETNLLLDSLLLTQSRDAAGESAFPPSSWLPFSMFTQQLDRPQICLMCRTQKNPVLSVSPEIVMHVACRPGTLMGTAHWCVSSVTAGCVLSARLWLLRVHFPAAPRWPVFFRVDLFLCCWRELTSHDMADS